MRDLNLARQPFLNVRPVKRVALLLLLLGLALTAVNALLYWQHFTGEGKTRNRSQGLVREIASEEAEIARQESQIAALDIDNLNRRTRFINRQIDRRRFGWSRLFGLIGEVQPHAVRLVSLIPRFGEERSGPRRVRTVTDEVSLSLIGVAKSGEAILEFIDRLFEHPAFRDPEFSRESRRDDGSVDFALSVIYLPDVGDADAEPTAEDMADQAEMSDDETPEASE